MGLLHILQIRLRYDHLMYPFFSTFINLVSSFFVTVQLTKNWSPHAWETQYYCNSVPSFFVMVQINHETFEIHKIGDTCTRKLSSVAYVQPSTDATGPRETQMWNLLQKQKNTHVGGTQYWSLRATQRRFNDSG